MLAEVGELAFCLSGKLDEVDERAKVELLLVSRYIDKPTLVAMPKFLMVNFTLDSASTGISKLIAAAVVKNKRPVIPIVKKFFILIVLKDD